MRDEQLSYLLREEAQFIEDAAEDLTHFGDTVKPLEDRRQSFANVAMGVQGITGRTPEEQAALVNAGASRLHGVKIAVVHETQLKMAQLADFIEKLKLPDKFDMSRAILENGEINLPYCAEFLDKGVVAANRKPYAHIRRGFRSRFFATINSSKNSSNGVRMSPQRPAYRPRPWGTLQLILGRCQTTGGSTSNIERGRRPGRNI